MSQRDEFIKGPNALRLAQIEQSLQRIKDAGFEREAELLRSEIEMLRQKAGAVYDSVEPVFKANVKWRKQPKNAALARHRSLDDYKFELREWALQKYLQEKQWRRDNEKVMRPKKDAPNSADEWLLKLYWEDRKFESETETDGKPIDATMGNLHGSPEPPIERKFKPTKNFFYKAIQNLS
ncbi:hypothetical protein [Idiomarina baltica]|uniref:Uncharacterized protein n=1 Tax=Idiomarina baltica OS145 TaxID=314276 RepID=A0ABM9WNJ9_9GAMM|nr:hypothetical protein [Idiomarina baltica]EAQ32577.1 hypothetical protein OS145_08903 [Idiomarina baltica OS145]